MADDKLANLLTTQISLTEWLEHIKHAKSSDIRTQDSTKSDRLNKLNTLINLPCEISTVFPAADLSDDNPTFTAFLKERGEEVCRLRLNPTKPDLPKLRMRGKTVREAYAWFKQQKIDPRFYKADFAPHPTEHTWATIFFVSERGIQGEIVYGCHSLLTQGFYEETQPIAFKYNFSTWSLSRPDTDAEAYLKTLIKHIHVPNKTTQKKVIKELGASFVHDYLEGYFESADSPVGLTFIDYSQAFKDILKDLDVTTGTSKNDALVSGQSACPGTATGHVKIVKPGDLGKPFPEGTILVCDFTSPDYVGIMQKAAAIVTDRGGILSHAAIVARELKKPCIVGTGNATKLLKDGQTITVDATTGIVTT